MINDHKTQGEWKIQLKMQIKIIYSIDSGETRIMHTKNDNIEIMIGSETVDIISELREPLQQNYQEGLEESMRGSEFDRDSVDLLYYHLHRISLKRSGSYVDSQKWLKNKKSNNKSKKNDDDNYFQYALTVALN